MSLLYVRGLDLLVLDEPTDHLDFLGVAALEAALARYRGGLAIVTHDPELLNAIGVEQRLELGSSAASREARVLLSL